ncbi:MAG: hypothetical protein IK099_04330 [Clostridia bacterium]|nr:hypothetical protein [Clostridia bacterium]
MMKLKDIFCLFAGIALLALAFLLKGCGEESGDLVQKKSAMSHRNEQVSTDHSVYPLNDCKKNREQEYPAIETFFN